MAKENNLVETKAEPKKRHVLTAEQRIAKMEADLKAAREKVQAKAKAKVAAAEQKVTDLKARRAKLDEQIATAEAEVTSLKEQAGTQDTAPAES